MTAKQAQLPVNSSILNAAIEMRRQVIVTILEDIVERSNKLKRGTPKARFTFGGKEFKVHNAETLATVINYHTTALNRLNTQIQFRPTELGKIVVQVGGKVGERTYELASGRTLWNVVPVESSQVLGAKPAPKKPAPKPAPKPEAEAPKKPAPKKPAPKKPAGKKPAPVQKPVDDTPEAK